MRILIGLLVVGAAIGGFMKYRHHEELPAPAPVRTVAASQPTSSRAPSEHNWAKSALDRAGDVKKQVLEQRKQNDGN